MRFGIVFALLALMAGLFLFGLRRDPSLLPSVLAEKQKPAPEFTLPVLLPYRAAWGEELRLSQHFGRPIVLNFWASWCPPCRREAPMLEAYWQRYQDQVLFLGVNFQDTEEAALAFIQEFGLSFPSVADPRGRVGIDYGVYGLPETFFIDAEGRVLARHVGELKPKDLEGYLRALLP
ncbi:TlpA disulfide reductase family protein [Thermus sp. FJN-A]